MELLPHNSPLLYSWPLSIFWPISNFGQTKCILVSQILIINNLQNVLSSINSQSIYDLYFYHCTSISRISSLHIYLKYVVCICQIVRMHQQLYLSIHFNSCVVIDLSRPLLHNSHTSCPRVSQEWVVSWILLQVLLMPINRLINSHNEVQHVTL